MSLRYHFAADAVLTDAERGAYLQPFLSYVTASLSGLNLTGQILLDVNPWKPKLHDNGVDVSVLLTSPALKKGILTYSWDVGAGDRRWTELLAAVENPQAVNLVWRAAWYRAVSARLPLFLAALAALQNTRLRRADTLPFNQVLSAAEAEQAKQEAQTLVDGESGSEEDSAEPASPSESLGHLKDPAWLASNGSEFLAGVLQRLGSTGWIRLIAADASALSRGEYLPLDFSTPATQLAAKLSKGKYRGEVGVGINVQAQLLLTIAAPFPITLVCRRGSGTALAPLAVGIGLGELLLAAPSAQGQELVMGVLALGLAALLARRSPEKAVKRGRLSQILSPGETAKVREAIPIPEEIP